MTPKWLMKAYRIVTFWNLFFEMIFQKIAHLWCSPYLTNPVSLLAAHTFLTLLPHIILPGTNPFEPEQVDLAFPSPLCNILPV